MMPHASRRFVELPAAERREHCVSVRLNDAELAFLDRWRGKHRRGEWLRISALYESPPVVPELNREAWLVLAKCAGNLSTIACAMRNGEYVQIENIRAAVTDFRAALIEARQ